MDLHQIIMALLTYLSLGTILASHSLATGALFGSHLDLSTSTPTLNLDSLMTDRNIDGNVVLQRAAIIFKDRLSTSTPLQDAALDLLHFCKAAKDIADPRSAKDMEEKAKQIYAVRAAIIDLTSASVDAPRACVSLGRPSQRSWYQSMKSSLSHDANSFSSNEISACLREFFKVDNSWTSFTSHRQDANTLCEVPGTDNASRMIMELLQDMNTIVPDWINTFRSEQEAHRVELERRKNSIEEIIELEARHKEELDDSHRDSKIKVAEMVRAWHDHFSDMKQRSTVEMTDLRGHVGQMRKDLESHVQTFLTARQDHDSLLSAYQAVVMEALAAQQQGIHDVESAANVAIAAYDVANANVLTQNEAFARQMQNNMEETTLRQLAMQQSQADLAASQDDNLRRQKETLVFTKQLEDRVTSTVGEVSRLLHTVEPAMRAASAVMTGSFGLKAYVVSIFGAVTTLLLLCGCVRYALIFSSLAVLGWTVPSLIAEVTSLANALFPTIDVSPRQLHVAWPATAAIAVFLSGYGLSRVLRARRRQVSAKSTALRQVCSGSQRIREMRRYQSVEPDMMWY